MRLIVTDADERAALAVTRSLGRLDEVFVAAPGRVSLAGASRFAAGSFEVSDPLADPSGFSSGIAEHATRLGAELVIPVSDASCRALLDSTTSMPVRRAYFFKPGMREFSGE